MEYNRCGLFWFPVLLVSGMVSSYTQIYNICNICICQNSTTTMRYTVRCNGRKIPQKMTSIPIIPNITQELIFINNNITELTESTIANMRGPYLTHLNLSNNYIAYIEETAFRPLKYLEVLDISKNDGLNMSDACTSFKSISRSIQFLALNHMLWRPEPNMIDMFDGLQNSSVSTIELSHSYLNPFNGSWFRNLLNLTSLDISWNSIQDNELEFSGLSNLKILSLIGNYFNYVPDLCKHELRNLKILYLSNTRLGSLLILQNRTKCLSSLNTLHISGVSVPVIPNNAFSELKNLTFLRMVRLSTQLKRIRPYAFNSSSLIDLKFSKCDGFFFSKESLKTKYFTPNIFSFSKNMKTLDLSYNSVQFDVDDIKNMFNPLTKLETIILAAMDLTEIPTDFFGRFKFLNDIKLDHNRITAWSDGDAIFRGLKRLTTLSLKNNKISHITPTTFPAYIRETLRSLDLSNNRFTCSCPLLWFRNWLKVTNIDIVGKSVYMCDSDTFLRDFHPTYFECSDMLLIIMVSSCCGVGFLTLFTIFVYCCRWRIRFQLYKIRSRSRYHKMMNEDEYKYTAYIIYCYEDLSWVKSNLIPKLEKGLGLRLCIPHRDFELGTVFADNIVDNMNVSKTVLPILSNNFSKNEWCLFQLAVARSKLSKEGAMSIMPILLEEIKFKNMNSAIYSLVNLTSYAAWSTDENAIELFWNQLKNYVTNSNS